MDLDFEKAVEIRKKAIHNEEPLTTEKLQICQRCVMDTTDPEISFDDSGFCNHCKKYFKLEPRVLKKGDQGRTYFTNLIQRIKEHGQGKKGCMGAEGERVYGPVRSSGD